MSRAPAENAARYLDAAELARTQTLWECDFNATRFPRLGEAAGADTPAVSVRLQFAQWSGRPAVRGHLSGVLELTCQRCMKRFRHEVDETFDLVIADSGEESETLPESHEVVETDAGRLDVHWLVEEQLLLALPLIPKHEDETECRRASAPPPENRKESVAAEEKRQRPFANLRELLRDDR